MDAAGHESVSHELPSPARESRVPHRFQLILVWAVWGAMTLAAILYIRHYTRNIPFADDFALIPMMTGHEPVSLRWAWSQHNEHRPVLSRLILAGLSRYVKNDFRSGRYFNAGLVAMAAASMLLLARRLRGPPSSRMPYCPCRSSTSGRPKSC